MQFGPPTQNLDPLAQKFIKASPLFLQGFGSLQPEKIEEIKSPRNHARFSDPEKYAQEIWKAIKEHQYNPPHQNIFEKAWAHFASFVRWLFRWDLIPSEQELRLSLAMNLFRNWEPGLLSHLQSGYALPFSLALEDYYHSLLQSSDHLASSKSNLEALKDCIEYAKTIESSRKASAGTRTANLKKLAKSIEIKFSKLEPGNSIYIPGGLMEYENTPFKENFKNLLLKDRGVRIDHLLYEIIQGTEGKLTLRVYNFSKNIEGIIGKKDRAIALFPNPDSCEAAVASIEINSCDFFIELANLLEVCATPHVKYNMSWVSSLRYNWSLGSKVLNEEDDFIQKDFSRIRFAEIFKKFKEKSKLKKVKGTAKKQHHRTDPVKIVEVFEKFCTNSNYDYTKNKYRKLLNKTLIFLDIFKAHEKNLISNHIMRKWLRDSAIHLLKNYKKAFGCSEKQPACCNQIILHFSEIIDRIEAAAQQDRFRVPSSPSQQAPSPSKFEDLLTINEPSIPMDEFSLKGEETIPLSEPLEAIEFAAGNSREMLIQFERWVQQCGKLSEQKRLADLNFALQDIYYSLEAADEANFWEKIPAEDLEKWSAAFHRLSLFSTQVHFGLHLKGPNPQQILHLLKLLYRVYFLAKKNNSATCFQDYSIDMEPFKDTLKDPYLDLGSPGPEIKSIIAEMEKGDYPLDLTSACELKKQPEHDSKFFSLYKAKFKLSTAIEEDFGKGKSGLAPQIIHLRQMKILMLAMMAKNRCLGRPEVWVFTLNIIRSAFAFLRNKTVDLDSEYLKKFFDDIEGHLRSDRLPIDFEVKNYFLYPYPVISIQAYGVNYLSYDHSFIEKYGSPFAVLKIPTPQYIKTAQEVPPALGRHVVEGCVAAGHFDYVNEDGFEVNPAHCDRIERHRFIPTGVHKTEREIFNDLSTELNLPREAWAELRSIQSSPLGMRIPGTLAFFSRYPSYLTRPFQRVFSLNLFRNGALHEYFSHQEKEESFFKGLDLLKKSLQSTNNVEGILFVERITRLAVEIYEQIARLNNKKEQPSFIPSNNSKDLKKWRNKPELIKNPRSIHYEYLLDVFSNLKRIFKKLNNDFSDTLDLDTCLKIVESYFFIKQIPEPMHERNREHEEQIAYLMHRLSGTIISYLREYPEKRHQFLNQLTRSQTGKDLIWKETSSKLCYESELYKVDLEAGLLYEKEVTKCHLPDAAVTNPMCRALFNQDKKIHEIICKRWNVYRRNISGQVYQFFHHKSKYRIVLMPGRCCLIYKKIAGTGKKAVWHQLQTLTRPEINENGNNEPLFSEVERLIAPDQETVLEMKKRFPYSHLPDGVILDYYWRNCLNNDFIVEDASGKFKFAGKATTGIVKPLEENSILCNVEVSDLFWEENNHQLSLLNPWHQPEFARFLALAPCNQVMAIGQKGKVERIKYLGHRHEYVWNPSKQTWDNLGMPGYHLSSKKIEEVIELRSKAKPKSGFFDSSYNSYQLLEPTTIRGCPTKPYSLLLSGVELHRSISSADGNYLARYNRKTITPRFPQNSKQAYPVYQYEIDPLSGLRCSSSEGYFYLAYVLFTQSKYDQALFYLGKAQNIKPSRSQECLQILEWFEKWKISPRSHANSVLLHVHLLILEKLQREKTDKDTGQQYYHQVQRVVHYFSVYLLHEKKGILDPRLAISYKQRQNLNKYFISTEESLSNIQDLNLSYFKPIDLQNDLLSDLRNALAMNEKNLEDEKAKLDDEIKSLEEKIDRNTLRKAQKGCAVPLSTMTEGTSLFPEYESYLVADELDLTAHETLEHQLVLFTEGVEKLERKDALAGEIGNELLNDTIKAKSDQKSEKNKLNDNVDLDLMEVNFTVTIGKLEKNAYKYKKQIMALLRLPMSNRSGWDAPINRLKEYSDTIERYFIKVLHCCYTENWDDLIDPESMEKEKEKEEISASQAIVKPENIEEIKSLAASFLKNKTRLQQYQKAFKCLREYQETKLIIHLNRLGELLAVKRYYDPDTDPNRFKLLLLEHEQQLIATKDQIECYIANGEIRNLFIHRRVGGGKTTMSRYLALNPDGTNLCGVVTDESLIDIHHPLLEDAMAGAYGLFACRFEFNRGDPSDSIALRKILRNFLKIIVEKGVLDFTKRDLLSLRHLLIEKYQELKKLKRPVLLIHEEIDILQKIIRLLQTRGCFGCDEFDKISTPTTWHNWAIGNKTLDLDQQKCNAVLKLMQWCLQDPLYREYFQKGKQHYLKENEIKELLENLARNTIAAFGLKGNEIYAMMYFTKNFEDKTDPDLALVDEYYETHIKKHPNKEELVWIYKFMHSVIPNSLNKQNGVRYIRSEKDKFSVKPTSRNGKCNELSEHCTEEEGMWYACLNYMDLVNGGVTAEQVALVVAQAKNSASKMVLESCKTGADLKFENTEEYLNFKSFFDRDLFNITENDFPEIAREISENPKKLANFLRWHVFPQNEIKEQKLSGTTENFANMMDQFYGCSGTTNNALPEKVVTRATESQPYAKQPGVDGKILIAIFKDLSPEDLIPTNFDNPYEAAMEIGSYLRENPGSSLIDLAAIFAGMVASKVAQTLAPYMPGASLRYKKEENREEVLNTTNNEVNSTNPNINIEEVNNVFAKDEERGVHMDLALNGVSFLTLNQVSLLTEFLQACGRPRRLGKGQKLRYFTPGTVSLIDLILTYIFNESKEQKKIQNKSQQQKITSVLENSLFTEGLCQIIDHQARAFLAEISEDYFVKPTQQRIKNAEDLDRIGRPAAQKTAIEALIELALYELKSLKSLLSKLHQSELEEIANLSKKLTLALDILEKKSKGEGLPDPIFLPAYSDSRQGQIDYSEIDSVNEAVKESENSENSKELDIDTDQVQEQEQVNSLGPLQIQELPWEDLEIKSIEALSGLFTAKQTNPSLFKLSEHIIFYNSNLWFTRNLYDPDDGRFHWGMEDPQTGLNYHLMRPHRIVLVVDKKSKEVNGVLGCIKDFDHIFSKIDKAAEEKEPLHFYIYDLYLNQLEGCNASWKSYSHSLQEKITEVIVQAKLFSGAFELLDPPMKKGDSNKIYDQRRVFKKWLSEKMLSKEMSLLRASPKQLEANFVKYLKRMRPTSLKAYYHSRMHRIFENLEERISQFRLQPKDLSNNIFYEKEM